MPFLFRLLIFALLSAITTSSRAQTDDRYSDRRPEGSAYADRTTEVTPAVAYEEPEANKPSATSDWQLPPGTRRKLPFRFKRAPTGHDGNRVVLASATQPARLLPKPTTTERGDKSLGRSMSKAVGGSTTSMVSVAGSVAVVVGLFLIVAWMARRGAGALPPTLPRDALEVLGRKRFAGKQEMQLVRVGNKLVLIHISAGHAEALCEIAEPEEVDRLTGICYQSYPRSATKSFRETFDKFAQERPATRAAARPTADKLDLSIFEGVARRAS